MKQLFLVRHAKSDWENHNLKDFDRPLNPRGNKNAPEMVQRLVEKNFVPDLIVSSPALRAITTAKHFAAGWNINPALIKTEPTIYEANTKNLLKVINGLDNTYDKIALFGHNPGITDLLNYLTNDYRTGMPTCSIAILTFPFDDWNLVGADTGDLLLFDSPKAGMD